MKSKMRPAQHVTGEMRKQVSATITNIGNNVGELSNAEKRYLYDHLVNLVETCLVLAQAEKPPAEPAGGETLTD